MRGSSYNFVAMSSSGTGRWSVSQKNEIHAKLTETPLDFSNVFGFSFCAIPSTFMLSKGNDCKW